MKKNYLLKIRFIIGMVMMSALTVMAQPPAMVDVEPGSKGQLPTNFPTIAPAEEGVIPMLSLDDIGYDYNSYLDSYNWYATLSFGYYDLSIYSKVQLQKKNGETWETVDHLAEGAVACDVHSSGIYRLLFKNSDETVIGKSNEVRVEFPLGQVFSKCTSWWRQNYEEFALVGKEVLGSFDIVATVHLNGREVAKYYVEDGFYKYQWYRVNPNTGESSPIQGATQIKYIPTIDDAGYNLVLEVSGDDEHCTFVKNIPIAPVKFPVQASYDYVGKDGFVLNTDYIVPAEAFTLNMEYAMEENPGSLEISERKPGQYVFKGDVNSIDGSVVELYGPLYVTFVYLVDQDWDGDGVMEILNWNREAQVMAGRFISQLVVKPTMNGKPVSTTVEIIGRNIDNESTVVATAEAGGDGVTFEDVYSLGSGYYLKASATDGTLSTYYPSALLWQEGTAVLPGTDEEWNPLAFTIDVQSALPALTGKGTIEGTVQAAAGSIPAGVNANTYTIYLKQKGGDFVASQETSANGSYRLENVPAGDYEVFVNIDGCTIEQPNEVTLTADKPNATGVDFTVENFVITPSSGSVEKIDFNEDGEMNVTDVVTLINCISKNDFTGISKEAADVNGDGEVNVTDVVTLILMIATAK